ncbi:hypothetical protein [Streptomyces sp. CL12]|uniref:hypothetical protein n=1 Tax=Streptomyces sp. CL12 TaxID=3391744 RepID=UPI003A804C55
MTDGSVSIFFGTADCRVVHGDGTGYTTDLLLGGPATEDAPVGGSSLRVVASSPPADSAWAHHNLRVAEYVRDLRLGEVVAVRAADPSYSWWARFTPGARSTGAPADDRLLAGVWADMTRLFGALPWGHVDVLLGDHAWPRGVSFPGIVLLSAELVERQPRAARYVYLVHELLHQWFGNLGTLPPAQHEACEAYVDALTWKLACDRLPPRAGAAYRELFAGYAQHGSDGLGRRGAEAAAYRDLLDDGRLIRVLGERLERIRRSVADTGRRGPVAMLP